MQIHVEMGTWVTSSGINDTHRVDCLGLGGMSSDSPPWIILQFAAGVVFYHTKHWAALYRGGVGRWRLADNAEIVHGGMGYK